MSLIINNAVKSRSRHFCYLVQIDHPEENLYLNTGYRNLDHDIGEGEKTWLGIGRISEMELPEETPAIEISKFSLSIIGSSAQTQQLMENKIRGNRLRIWVAFLNDHHRVIATELLEEAGQDRLGENTQEDGSRVTTLYCNGNFAFLTNQSVERWTPEHQIKKLEKLGLDPASDTGFDDQHLLPQKNDGWFR